MNAVRKHLSVIKGGRLALAAHPARVVTPKIRVGTIKDGKITAIAGSFACYGALAVSFPRIFTPMRRWSIVRPRLRSLRHLHGRRTQSW
jgi:hypothetical protein